MLKLQGDFRPFLGDATVLEGVGKLISLANPHEELRLCKQPFAAHAAPFAGGGERGEIDMGSKNPVRQEPGRDRHWRSVGDMP